MGLPRKRFNDFSYEMFDGTGFAARIIANYLGGNFSTDGAYVLGDRGLPSVFAGLNTCPIPAYVPATFPVTTLIGVDTGFVDANGDPIYETQESISMESLTGNHPHYSQQQALYIASIAATGDGLNDGWLWEVVT